MYSDRNTESKKLRIEKPLTGEILRSMKCEVTPSDTVQWFNTRDEGVYGIKRQVSNANKETRFSRCQQKKATPPNHIQR